MSNDSPGRWQNVADSELKVAKPIDDVDMLRIIGNQRHLYELVVNDAAGENQIVHGHSHGDITGTVEDGFPDRRPLFSQSFLSGSASNGYEAAVNTSWTDTGLRIRSNAGPWRRFATELYARVSSGGAVKFRVERWDWNDSSDDTDDGGGYGTNALQESSASFTATALSWHTIDGVPWSATAAAFTGSSTKLCVVSGPTSMTTLDEINTNMGIHLAVCASGSACTLYIESMAVMPAKTVDEGVGEIWT